MDKTKSTSTNNKLALILKLLLVIATLCYLVVLIAPICRTTFIEDDYFFIERASQIQESPFSFFTLSFNGFYRPLGYNLPSLIFLIIGYNSFVFHVIGFLIHILTAFILYLFLRKLLNSTTGFLAAILYAVFPHAFTAVGFASCLYQDELSALFFILTLLVQLRTDPEKLDKKSYLLPAVLLLLGSWCKDSWMGMIPAVCVMDWVNYPRSKLRERLHRLWVFSIVLITILLRLIFVDTNQILHSSRYYMEENLTIENILYGFTLPFLPWEISDNASWTNAFRLIAPLGLIIVSLLIKPDYRLKILVLTISFLGVFITLTSAPLTNWFWGWAHLFPLVAFSTAIMAHVVITIASKLKKEWFVLSIISIVVFIFAICSYTTSRDVAGVISNDSRYNEIKLRGFANLIKTFPVDADIYSTGGPPHFLTQTTFLEPEMSFTVVAIGKKTANREEKGWISGTLPFVRDCLSKKIDDKRFRLIIYTNKKWIDLTEAFKNSINEGTILPAELLPAVIDS